MKAKIVAICVAAFFATAGARADDVSSDLACKFHHAVIDVGAFKRLPASIANFVLGKTGEMAERGQYFNATDVILKSAPMHRFIRAGHEGTRWFVWFEHGGIAYNKNIAVFDLAPKEVRPRLVAHILYFQQNPCELTDAALDGRATTPGAGTDWW